MKAKEFFDAVLDNCGYIEYTYSNDQYVDYTYKVFIDHWHDNKYHVTDDECDEILLISPDDEVEINNNELIYRRDLDNHKFRFYQKAPQLNLLKCINKSNKG